MKKLYPLKFKPEWKPKAWGGESWDLCGFDDEASVISEGFLAESDLADVLETYMGDLTGEEQFDWYNLHFPLLIKHLDIQDRLSVQVHPDDEIAAERFDAYGKCEFWYVTEAGPDARIYMGFKEDTDASVLYRACREGRVTRLLNTYIPRPGDCFFIPAGTVHAAGGGVKVAEVQEASDITFRLYDWGRELDPATRREMHLEEALDCIDYRRFDEEACCGHLEKAEASDSEGNSVRRLIEVPQFVIDSLRLRTAVPVPAAPSRSCIVYICTEGSVSVRADGSDYPLAAGETMLIPASLDAHTLSPAPEGVHLLRVHLPQPPRDDVYEGPEPEAD